MSQAGNAMSASDAKCLPIFAAFARKIGVVEEIDRLCWSGRGMSPGRIVLALVIDALSGRSPLFRLSSAFSHLDTGLLLGEEISPLKLNDDAVGRALDRVYEVGTGTVLTAICLRAVKLFNLDTRVVRHDTTSHSVYGAYEGDEASGFDQPFKITFGFSKKHRPDLKQLVHSLLCVDSGVPMYSKCENGNESDKTVNRNLIPKIVARMRELGQSNFLYVADSALVTRENLRLMGDAKTGFRFLSRLPMTFNECGRVIAEAVIGDQWEELGVLSDQPATKSRKPAYYRGYECTAPIDAVTYRTLVVHSDALDERRSKRLEKLLKEDLEEANRIKSEREKVEFACLADAQSAIGRVPTPKFHDLDFRVEERAVFSPGRPKGDGSRKVVKTTYQLTGMVKPRDEAIARARIETGCFVLITNEPSEAEGGMNSKDLLAAYKDQHSIERNFGFLKDPLIVNALFLKTERRIEALALILVIALMVWRLMERTMRVSLKETQTKVEGWNKRPTSRPTSFMMTTKFLSVIVAKEAGGRYLPNAFTEVQRHYLALLGLSETVFVDPYAEPNPNMYRSMSLLADTG